MVLQGNSTSIKIDQKSKIWFRFNLKQINKVIIACSVIGLVYYLTGTNDLSVKGFALRELRNKTASLTTENKSLQSRIAASGSYVELAKKAQDLRLVAVSEIEYLKINNVVAKK